MNLADYQTLTGITVASSDQARVTAELIRSRKILESMLGYTLDSSLVNTNLYNEAGKSQTDCAYPIDDLSTLAAPDAVVTAYRLYDFNLTDEFWHVDPFTTLNSVKLVYIKQGAVPSGVTVKTYEATRIREHQGRDTWSKYISYTPGDFWACRYDHHLQLAVDAVWQFTTIPDELKYVWADMVTFNSSPQKDIKSESVLTHSWTKFDNQEPQTESYNNSVLTRYAGPHGTLSKVLVA